MNQEPNFSIMRVVPSQTLPPGTFLRARFDIYFMIAEYSILLPNRLRDLGKLVGKSALPKKEKPSMKRWCILTLLATGITMQAPPAAELNAPVKICVISDPHLYDSSLGTSGSAFEAYLNQDRKMLAESEAIFKAALGIIQQQQPNILFIPGDLTKDGEKINHEKMVQYLTDLEKTGVAVYVVPGNHDIMNPDAVKFEGANVVPVPSITPEEFATLYADFGYREAAARDPNSLSYVTEPVPGIWLFGIDACQYRKNTGTSPVTGGSLSTETTAWLLSKLQEARQNGKIAIGIIHHGLLEHFTGQKTFFSEYVLDDYQTVSQQLAQAGLQMVFTGHFHAQDISMMTWPDGSILYDVETGSLLSYPVPVRTVVLQPDLSAQFISQNIQTIDYNLGGKTFPQYAMEFLTAGVNQLAIAILTMPPEQGGYGIPAQQAALVAPSIASALIAHYSGNEIMTSQIQALINTFLASGDQNMLLLGTALTAIWTDLPPDDLTLEIHFRPATKVAGHNAAVTQQFALMQNFPNPFNPSTQIAFSLGEKSEIRLRVYDMAGRAVRTLANGSFSAGTHRISFNSDGLTSGVYLYQLETPEATLQRTMLLVK